MKRDDAARALSLGFRRDTLLALHHQEKPGGFISDQIYVVQSGLFGEMHFYRTSTAKEVERAFRQGMYLDPIGAYADGSGTSFDKPAGIGVTLFWPSGEREMIAENIGLGSNNRAELCAVWRALRAFPHVQQKLVIYTDSEYAIGSLTKDWAPQKNVGLIVNIRADLALRPHVQFEHVAGHAGVAGNETADLLSKIGRKWTAAATVYEGD